MSEEQLRKIFTEYRVIAVVGLSREPEKASFKVSSYMKEHDFQIIPVNPFCDEVLGEKCYASLQEIPVALQKMIDIVDIFRPSNEVRPLVEQVIKLKEANAVPTVVWMQLGIRNEEAAEMGKRVGLTVIMDKCIMVEHYRLC
jgi:predicted CoA-binding protein